MVSRRKSDHTTLAGQFCQLADRIVGPPKLECAAALQILAFQKDLPPDNCIKGL
jgi:hypothetical protein